MLNNNGVCQNCGEKLQNNLSYCTSCGAKVELEMNSVFNGNAANERYSASSSSKGGSKKKAVSIVSVVLALVFSVVGRIAGGTIGESFVRNDQINKIESYIEDVEKYVPGTLTEDKYISGHFGIQFETDENWTMYTKEDLAPISENSRNSSLAAGEAAFKEESDDQELYEKWVESIYCECEMGASYVADNMYVGESLVAVYGGYGVGNVTQEEYVKQIKEKILSSSQAHNIIESKETLAGAEYDVLKLNVESDGMKLENTMYVRMHEGMICMITCKALEGYEEQVYDSFLNQISAYN